MKDLKYKQAREYEEKYDKALLFKDSLEKKALEAYKQAADLGSTEAMYRLAIYYSNYSLENKKMGERYTPQFFKYIEKAVEENYEPAILEYAFICFQGGKHNKALMLYEKIDIVKHPFVFPMLVTLCHKTKREDKLYLYLTIMEGLNNQLFLKYEEEYYRLSYIYGDYFNFSNEISDNENLYNYAYDINYYAYNEDPIDFEIEIFAEIATENFSNKMNQFIYHSSRHLLREYFKENKDEIDDAIDFYKEQLSGGSLIQENKESVLEGDFTRFSPRVAWALGYLGELYLDGLGVKKDVDKGYKMLKASYDIYPFNIDVNVRLGDCYYYGYGVETSMELAYHHYTNAYVYYDEKWYNIFNDDSIFRELELGWSAYKCHEYKKAFPLIKKHVEIINNNHSSLLHGYAYMLHYGLGCEVDYDKAATIYQKNVDLNNSSYSMNNLGSLYTDGTGVPQDHNIAFSLYSKAHSMNPDTYTRYNLGRCYMYGWGVQEDYELAYSYLIQNKDTNHYWSLKLLALFYRYGDVVKQDYKKAFEYFYKVNENLKDKQSKYELARCYYYGYGTDQNREIAFKYFKELSDENYVKAYVFVGSCYYGGYGVEKDKAKAYEYYSLANTHNKTSITTYNLGLCYEHGYGVEANLKTAISLYKESLSLGGKKAKEKLEKLNIE